jgi:hypothetical protein
MATTTSPNDLLIAYDPGSLPSGQSSPLEVLSSGPFGEMTGGADTHFEDFTSGLRAYVESQREAGSAMGGTWFGGSGANPSGIVLGLDWAEEDMDLEEALGDPEPDPDPEPEPPINIMGAVVEGSAEGNSPAGIMGAVVEGSSETKPAAGAGIMATVVKVTPAKRGDPEPARRETPDGWVFADPDLSLH